MAERKTVKDFYGYIIGTLEDGPNDIIAKDRFGKILGKFDKRQGVTKDFYGRILGQGDLTSALIWDSDRKLRPQKYK